MKMKLLLIDGEEWGKGRGFMKRIKERWDADNPEHATTTQKETEEKGNSERKQIIQTTTDSNEWCRTKNINVKNAQGDLDRQTQVQENKTTEDN